MKGNLTETFNKVVLRHMLVKTRLTKADIGFVFGNIDHAEILASHAAKLYHKGYFKKVLLSGSDLKGLGITEAERMRQVMLKSGVLDSDIIIEDKSTNTGENAFFGLKLIDKEIGLKNVKSILAVGHISAGRRFLMTLEKHCPQMVKMFSSCNHTSIPISQWHQNDNVMNVAFTELNKIPEYRDKGFIKDIDLNKINAQIKKLKKDNLKPKG